MSVFSPLQTQPGCGSTAPMRGNNNYGSFVNATSSGTHGTSCKYPVEPAHPLHSPLTRYFPHWPTCACWQMSMIHHRRHPHKPEKKMSLGPFKMITCSHFHKASSTILTGDTDIEPPLHMYSATSANPKNPCRDCRDCRHCRHHSDLVVDL